MTRLAAQYPPYRLNALALQVGAAFQNLSKINLSFPCPLSFFRIHTRYAYPLSRAELPHQQPPTLPSVESELLGRVLPLAGKSLLTTHRNTNAGRPG